MMCREEDLGRQLGGGKVGRWSKSRGAVPHARPLKEAVGSWGTQPGMDCLHLFTSLPVHVLPPRPDEPGACPRSRSSRMR